MKKLAYKIRTKNYLLTNKHINNDEYIPQIYKKIQGWHPPPTSESTENRIIEFEKIIKEAITKNKNNKKYFSNLTPQQHKTLNELKNNNEFVILSSDKNLGPAIMNWKDYVSQVLSEHLMSSNYKRLSPDNAKVRLQQTKQLLIQTFHNNKHLLSQAEIKYFTRSFQEQHRIPMFYGMPKVHKSPITLRPVVSCINSFNSIFSNWIDLKMKELLPIIPSYIKDSREFLTDIKTLTLPPNSKIFTADATAMYTNIDTATGIKAIKDILHQYNNQIDALFPREFFLSCLEIVMENNIFTFGDSFWIQTQGTAMGTPAAPLYSILTFGLHENNKIITQFKNNLFYYKRYIDDVFGIWIDTPDNQWEQFKNMLNQFGNLKWNIEEPSKHTTFLDLEITIKDNKLTTKTFQKPMNLYLYISPSSAHPYSCFKGLITGEIIRYWQQNTNEEDFIEITSKFIQRLINRGHQIETLIPIFRTVASSIDRHSLHIRNENHNDNNDNTLYLHWEYHPQDITKNQIREAYNKTLKGHDNFNNMRIAVSRPKNLRDILCHTKLQEHNGTNVSDIIRLLEENNI